MNEAAHSSEGNFLPLFKKVKRSLKGWSALCPAHPDKHASLSIARAGDRWLLNCHSHCSIEAITAAVGLTVSDLFFDKRRHNGNGTYEKIVASIKSRPEIVAEFVYATADGEPYLKVQRTAGKQFIQSQWLGAEGWYPGKPEGHKIPYRLPELLESESLVYVTEGEKDADRLASFGLTATSASEGAGNWTPDLNQYFKDRDVVILADNDRRGRDHARQVATKLSGIAARVRVVDLPGLPPKGDVSDWLDAGNTIEALNSIVDATPDGVPDEEADRMASPRAKPAEEFSAAELQQMKFPPIAWVVRRYVAEGVTILAGKPKLGKSWLALDWAIAIARGGFTMGDIQCAEGDVLYLAMEDNQRRLQGRMRKLVGDVPWPARLAFRTKLDRLDEGGTEDVRDWLESVPRPRLVVVDVLASVRSLRRAQDNPYEADYAVFADFKALADEFNVAILVIHHLRKMESDSDPFDMVSGTTGLTGAADTTLVLKGGSQGVTLYGRGRDVTEVEDAVTFDRDSCRWKLLGEASEVRRSDERKQIIETLKDDGGDMSPQEIARVIGSKGGTVRRLLGKMAKDGEVLKTKRGKYAYLSMPSNPGNNGNKVTTDEES